MVTDQGGLSAVGDSAERLFILDGTIPQIDIN